MYHLRFIEKTHISVSKSSITLRDFTLKSFAKLRKKTQLTKCFFGKTELREFNNFNLRKRAGCENACRGGFDRLSHRDKITNY